MCVRPFSGPMLMEMAAVYKNEIPYLPRHFDFKDGKLWPNDRPGLGVEFDAKRLAMTAEFTKRNQPIKLLR